MMSISIIGGNFGTTQKESNVINKLTKSFKYFTSGLSDINVINGGNITDLPKNLDADLNIWMPNIDNEEEKHYPIKKKGSVLICSKIMRSGYTHVDAVSRIFKMQGNAVIAIYTDVKPFKFILYDALSNIWYSGISINLLTDKIIDLYNWTKDSIRVNSVYNPSLKKESHPHLLKLIDINNKLASHIQTSCGNRFFGNISTRCQKLFPTLNDEFGIYVSPRNVDKFKLTPDDMVYMKNDMTYIGDKKPSVDAPVQINIYKDHPDIHYMIHGHARIIGINETEHYYPCGDLREVEDVNKIIKHTSNSWAVNLKNHGFLIYADTIENLEDIVNFFIKHGSFTYLR